jgi:hypothetical protein
MITAQSYCSSYAMLSLPFSSYPLTLNRMVSNRIIGRPHVSLHAYKSSESAEK